MPFKIVFILMCLVSITSCKQRNNSKVQTIENTIPKTQSRISAAKPASTQEYIEMTCMQCHGAAGANLGTPVIHGQNLKYLNTSLKSFQQVRGKRKREDHIMGVMGPIADPLSTKEIKDIAAFLSKQSPCTIAISLDKPEDTDQEIIAKGEAKVVALKCMNCHKQPNPMGAPQLAGQKSRYVIESLHNFKLNKRKSAMMKTYAARLSDDEINAIAVYFQSLRSCTSPVE